MKYPQQAKNKQKIINSWFLSFWFDDHEMATFKRCLEFTDISFIVLFFFFFFFFYNLRFNSPPPFFLIVEINVSLRFSTWMFEFLGSDVVIIPSIV